MRCSYCEKEFSPEVFVHHEPWCEQQHTVEGAAVKVDYNGFTVAELKVMCEDRYIEVPSNALKSDIVKLLEEDDAEESGE